MFDYFFVYGSELPEGSGFPIYGTAHLIWLASCTVVVIALLVLYHRLSPERRRHMDIAIGIFLLACIVIREIYLLAIGFFSVYEVPLHLCSLAGFLCFFHCLKDVDWAGQVLYSLCLPGTIAALIFPDWTYYPPIHFITIEGFLFHFGVALYVVCQLISKRIQPDIRKIWKVCLFILICVVPIYFLNRKWGTNYWFINAAPQNTPLEWIEKVMGSSGYLIGFGILALMVSSILDLLYMCFARAGKS
ncbi:MAG: TIGR02206 family membrane protein [Parasporobacterium sp.]|nr:TIGR02206 family membrane protein [Parasporobacterium sp.]